MVSWLVAAPESEEGAEEKETTVKFGEPIDENHSSEMYVFNVTDKEAWVLGKVNIQWDGSQISETEEYTDVYLDTTQATLMKVDEYTWDNFKKLIAPSESEHEEEEEEDNSEEEGKFECVDGVCFTEMDCEEAAEELDGKSFIVIVNETYHLSIPPAGYLVEVSEENSESKCMTNIIKDKSLSEKAIFGTSFLANFYAEFDYDAMTISLASNTLNGFNATI